MELMLTILILGVITAIGAPVLTDFIETQRVRSNVQQMSSVFQRARNEAVTRLGDVVVCWNSGGIDRTVEGVTIEPNEMAAIDVEDDELIREYFYQYPTLSYRDDSANDCITFDQEGRASAVLNFSACKSGTDSSDSQSIQISQMGRIIVLDNSAGGGLACS